MKSRAELIRPSHSHVAQPNGPRPGHFNFWTSRGPGTQPIEWSLFGVAEVGIKGYLDKIEITIGG